MRPSSDAAFLASSGTASRDASSDSARARISLVASKALVAEAAESEADFSEAFTASTEACESFSRRALISASYSSMALACSLACCLSRSRQALSSVSSLTIVSLDSPLDFDAAVLAVVRELWMLVALTSGRVARISARGVRQVLTKTGEGAQRSTMRVRHGI